ncbi:hypothetical protein [Desulfosediminicola ganghwensis]|uniref:hypothetical protein n=1 Tax=Desulfosediminicola ganghwensis TaxID=2569540 RepID=UPI0012946768|nr:hypothetical protein [Desulfosediminicola ganghwensis]
MKKKIKNILNDTPGIKAKKIAKILDVERKRVNSILHQNKDVFKQDDQYCWYLVEP